MTFERFTSLLAAEIGLEPAEISPGSLLVEELCVQSIDVLQLMEKIEATTGAVLHGVHLGQVQTVDQLYRALLRLPGNTSDHFDDGHARTA